jgi:hypothetical protein
MTKRASTTAAVSVLGADEFIKSRHRLPAGHGYSVRPRKPPGHPELIQSLAAQPENILRFIGKEISRILIPAVTVREMRPHPINAAITIGVEKPAGEVTRIVPYNGELPRLKVDLAQVLPAGPMLREKTRPVPRTAPYLGTAHVLLDAHLVARPDGAHGSLALLDEPRPSVSACDTELPYLLISRSAPADAAVSQVQAE